MKIFKLPDLGEGLPDAIIREWYVKVGDEIKTDQQMVAMETAKALVDVPAPFSGKVEKLFGEVGDTIDTDNPLIGFEGEGAAEQNTDAGTVVGSIEQSGATMEEMTRSTASSTSSGNTIKATPAVRVLARQLNVDLTKITPKDEHITAEEVKQKAQFSAPAPGIALSGEVTQLSGVRRAMVLSMTASHQQVVPATIMDDADLFDWADNQDVSIRILRAIQTACEAEPMLNCYYDSANMGYQSNERINIGIAVDTPHGLYVPVLKDVANCSDQTLRDTLNRFKEQSQTRSIPQADLQGATIIMSNFGAIAGQYAAPVVSPPMVAIIAFGRAQDRVVAVDKKTAIHRLLPISLTFDHRPVTGGDAARFLQAMIKSLQKPSP